MKAQNKIYISDAAIRNAVLMNEDALLNPEELGLLAETAVYKHVRTFYYNASAEVGYFRDSGAGKDKEIDVVVKMRQATPILIEVKYREESKIKESDAIIGQISGSLQGLVITKNDTDYGLSEIAGKRIYRIPAYAFLYLLGHAEKNGYNKY